MTRKEFVERLFGEKLFTVNNYALLAGAEKGCQGFECVDNANLGCSGCKYYGFWNKEVSLAELYANLSTSDAGKMLYKGFLNSIYGSHASNTNDTNQLYLFSAGWKAFPRHFNFIPSSALVEILSDGADNGFEFKLSNSTLYYREKDYANTDSAQDVD